MFLNISFVSIKLFLLFQLIFFCQIGFSQITISLPLNRAVFQRDTNNNASINITGSFTKKIDKIQARVIAINGGSTTEWQTISNYPEAGIFSGYISVTTLRILFISIKSGVKFAET